MTEPRCTVESVMSPSPHTIDAAQSLREASQLMQSLDLRHLPVLDEGRLCGVVSQRDLLLAETLIGFESRKAPVSDAMTIGAYAVPVGAPLADVVRTMAEKKYGCAVVVSGPESRVVGIVTTVDVCRVLAERLS
jgi:acetoin utilization protein AcuB